MRHFFSFDFSRSHADISPAIGQVFKGRSRAVSMNLDCFGSAISGQDSLHTHFIIPIPGKGFYFRSALLFEKPFCQRGSQTLSNRVRPTQPENNVFLADLCACTRSAPPEPEEAADGGQKHGSDRDSHGYGQNLACRHRMSLGLRAVETVSGTPLN